jgi:tetratricopeptide (TPR) repeat protein/tRNA A-37 threonylcarbamoyl transferase component Bud32
MIGKTISHYRILGQIGEGGMGVVYVAEDVRLGRRVAVKIPHAGRDERHYRARFLGEARAVSNLNHKNIAAVYDVGETDDGQPYIVMELVVGQTLGDILAGTGLSLSRAVEVGREVAEALAEAHRRGIVHRDIKPSNVIINDRGEVKVLDFGLAKQLDEERVQASGPDAQTLLSARTRSDVVIGTPLYLSPEQARGAQVDGRSDLFTLGVLLYECIAGRPAFSGANVIEIGAQVLHVDPPPPSRFNPHIPTELDRLTLKALAKKPEDRFQTADEFAAELARVRARFNGNDTTRTRRLASAENLVRSSALNTMAEGLRRPRFSPLTLAASLVALLLAVWVIAYLTRPRVHVPQPAAVVLYEQGVEAMREGAYYKASVLLKQSIAVDDKFALAHARLADALWEMDFLDYAKDEMLTVMTLVPDFGALPREDSLYLDAIRSTVGKDYANTVKDYAEIAKLKPDKPQVYVDLGRAYDRNYDTKNAIRNYTQATEHDPSYAAAFLRLGALHARQQNQAGAAEAFAVAEKLYVAKGNREGEAEIHYQQGRLFIDLKKKPEARRELERALELARSTTNVYQQVQILQQLSYAQEEAERANNLAQSAVELAQASGMYNLAAYGYITLGNLFNEQNNRDEAERNLMRALEFARTYKVRRLEALALANLASLYSRQGRLSEALSSDEQARDFYIQGGYRNEADNLTILIARLKRQTGDYEGALKIIDDLLRLAEQSNNLAMIGGLHREYGAVLALQEKYPQALNHYRESIAAARTLSNQLLLNYSLLNQANALWRLGRYNEAREALGQVTGAGEQIVGGKELLAVADAAEASLSVSQRRFPEAIKQGKQALALTQKMSTPSKDLIAEVDMALGLAESLSGAHASGRSLCEEAARLAPEGGDPWLVSNAQLALAQALLEDGDAVGAHAAALRAQEFFARSGSADSAWRALAIAGKASRRAGDEAGARDHFAHAAALLSQLEQSLGESASGYLMRPDVQLLRKELGGATVAGGR